MVKQSPSITFEQALARIVDRAHPVPHENISLADCWQRVTATELRAAFPDPGYDQSLRDGFVISKGGQVLDSGSKSYQIMGEIPAGRCDSIEIQPGEAYRIMTGGMVPGGADQVVQQEDCAHSGNIVEVPGRALGQQNHFIQRKGSFVAWDSAIVQRGTLLGAKAIGVLATTGNHHLEVHRRVSVSYFCTGDELVGIEDTNVMAQGQKISSNRYLLNSLIKEQGVIPVDCGNVDDDNTLISRLLSKLASSETDIIISTGGMGPGKYDLLETLFEELGGEVMYRSISMRPGRSTLFGIIAGKLYFGLPGPPSAVGVLFRELVLPAIRKMQGRVQYMNQVSKAVLEDDLLSAKSNVYTVKEGVLFSRECRQSVRLPERFESSNCHILLAKDVDQYMNGDVVTVHVFEQ